MSYIAYDSTTDTTEGELLFLREGDVYQPILLARDAHWCNRHGTRANAVQDRQDRGIASGQKTTVLGRLAPSISCRVGARPAKQPSLVLTNSS